ncbi:MAG: ATP-binding protein [Candidatus Nanopelagicales bacterium]|nr:ATP-binding protein [Candidatus Nanopelagicales bacterium]
MDPLRNPFTPNAGARPSVLIGRDEQLRSFELLLARLAAGRTEQSMIITGLRGVGKTVLLGQFRTMALKQGWAVVEWEVSKHEDDHFRRQLALQFRTALLTLSPRAKWKARAKRAAAVLRSFTITTDPSGNVAASIDLGELPALGIADSGDLGTDLTSLVVALGEAAKECGKGVVILLDEVQFLSKPQLEALIASLHRSVQLELPLTMAAAGLPQIAQLAGEAKSYAERLFRFPTIGILSATEAEATLKESARQEGADFASDAVTLAQRRTGNYPYFLQELGYSVWPIAEGPVITRSDVEVALPAYLSKLDSSFFRVRLDRATELETAYLRAMAELGPHPQSAADVARLLNRTSQQCGPTRSGLIVKGLLYTPSHGLAAFTVPQFDLFLKRVIPRLTVPAIKPRRRRGH